MKDTESITIIVNLKSGDVKVNSTLPLEDTGNVLRAASLSTDEKLKGLKKDGGEK